MFHFWFRFSLKGFELISFPKSGCLAIIRCPHHFYYCLYVTVLLLLLFSVHLNFNTWTLFLHLPLLVFILLLIFITIFFFYPISSSFYYLIQKDLQTTNIFLAFQATRLAIIFSFLSLHYNRFSREGLLGRVIASFSR